MADEYVCDLLRVSIAQICQTIGYNAIQTTPLELLQDNLHKFLQEFCRALRRHVEHYNRTEPNLDDVCLSLAGLNIDVNEMLEYIFNVQPVAFAIEIPKFPMYKESHLNFLKPGSKEVLVRPVHIFEHLPPILPSDNAIHEDVLSDSIVVHPTRKENAEYSVSPKLEKVATPELNDSQKFSFPFSKKTGSARMLGEDGLPAREIGSVVMTTGGFISPAMEGKLPDALIPDIIDKLDGLDALPPPTPKDISGCHSTKSSAVISTPALANSLVSSLQDQAKILPTVSVQSGKPNILSNKHQEISTSAEFFNSSSFENSPAEDIMILPKKHRPTQHSNLPPPLAARILKKAKKKHTILPFSKQEKTDMNDKEQRKRMRILQKLVKSAKTSRAEAMSCSEPNTKLKKIQGFYDPALLHTIPCGPEGSQMNKMLKKQAKHRQKLLKQQIAARDQPSTFLSLHKTQKETAISENINAHPSKTSSPTDQSSNYVSLNLHSPCEPKLFPTEETKGVNLLDGNILKSNPGTQNFVNSVPGFRGMNPPNNTMPTYGEAAFTNEKSYVDAPDNRSAEIKLSTEPDRSKLNIFKKISSKHKQPNKALSPTADIKSQTRIYSGSESRVINLPSGTTITPAPPTSGRHVYAPEDDSFRIEAGSISSVDVNTVFSNSILAKDSIVDVNKQPKKRGRKPGSKNQPKLQGLYMMPTTTKKQKKFKYQKNIFGPPMQLLADHSSEPLNLSHTFSLNGDIKSNISLGIASTYSMLDSSCLQRNLRERKGRKKTKTKDSSHAVGEEGSLLLQTMQHASVKMSDDLSAPTVEEVDSINRKLLRMDTILQPAPPAKLVQALPSQDISQPITSNKSNSSDSGISNQRSSQQQNNCGNLALTTSPCETLLSSVQSYTNLGPPNMLSMLPMYPFPTGPGLIPTPGLFPSILNSFSNNTSNPASNMLLHGFLPFSGLKSSGNSSLLNTGAKMNDKSDKPAESTDLERNYCNVAPLVPDSMKLKLSPSTRGNLCVISPKHRTFGDRDTSNIAQLKPHKLQRDAVRDSLQKKSLIVGTQETKNVSSTSLLSAAGVAFSNFEDMLRTGSALTPSNSAGFNDSVRSPASGKSTEYININSSATSNSLNIDDPIEVSDDSEDACPSTVLHSPTKFKTSTGQRSCIIGTSLLDPPAENINDLFVPMYTTKPSGGNQFTLSSSTGNEHKKPKTSKKSHSFDTRLSESDGGAKLAGGAEVIPLPVPVYSSEMPLANSLTKIAVPSTPVLVNKDYNPMDVLNTLTITSTSAVQDKYKDHKKTKKLKFGKLKKKKDKKEKIKNKEKYSEKRLNEKTYKQSNKEFSKKVKKEKKREKQRSSRSNLPSSPTAKTAKSYSGIEVNTTHLPSSHPFSTSPVKMTSSVVPKLTLKLGNCQSPTPSEDTKCTPTPNQIESVAGAAITRDPSPELARISPLITRPPKPKSSGIDTASNSVVMGGVSSSGSNILGPLTAIEAFGDKKKSKTCSNTANIINSSVPLPPWSSDGTLTASSTLLPQQLLQSSIPQHTHDEPLPVSTCLAGAGPSSTRSNSNIESQASLIHETSRPSSYIDEEGNRVWICPACGKVDDGSAMIGCDGCDAWYHWVCVGIFIAPKDNEDWFCRVCIARKKGIPGIDKKRKRNKKKIK